MVSVVGADEEVAAASRFLAAANSTAQVRRITGDRWAGRLTNPRNPRNLEFVSSKGGRNHV